MGPVDEGPFELRTGGIGLRLAIGLAVIAGLLAAAIVKPWPGIGLGLAASGSNSGPVPTIAIGDASRASGPSGASATIRPPASEVVTDLLCPGPTGWQVVVDDVELGRQVRTWLLADVVYSANQPPPASIPVTNLVSAGVGRLGLCRPPAFAGAGGQAWTGTIWREPTVIAEPSDWQLVARLNPLPGSVGAVASPIRTVSIAWPPGLYLLEAESAGSASAWLAIRIEVSPGG